METLKPVTSVKAAVLLLNPSVFAVDTTCNTLPPPPAGAAHLSPVAVALSATILQEQSQRIVLNLIAGELHPRLNLGDLVGLGAGLLW